MSLHIFHISNVFAKSAVFKNLFVHLDAINIDQTVYCATRTEAEAEYNASSLDHLAIYNRYILRPYDRLFFRNKIRKKSKDILNKVDLSTVDLIHAHTLYSDGAAALKIKNKLGIPYVVTVCSTDLNLFQKYRPDLRWRRNEILKEAKKIIVISPAHRLNFISLLTGRIRALVEPKTVTIPYGVHSLFLDCTYRAKSKDASTLKILYVGNFRTLKNVPKLISSVNLLSEQYSVKLTIVGEGGDSDETVKEIIESGDYPFINYLGRVNEKEKLRQIYRSHDIFAMISKPETFGLVYIEALSQGVPIIYTKGEGIDGYFEKAKIGEAVNNISDSNEVACKIMKVSEYLNNNLRAKCIRQAQQFNWPRIAHLHKDIYSSIRK